MYRNHVGLFLHQLFSYMILKVNILGADVAIG